MEKLSDSRLDYEDVFKLNSNKWDVNLKVGMNSIQTFNLIIEDNEIKINLFYNKSFKKISPYKSYSLNLRPDYTLKINFKDKYYFLHFDAKYKSTGISNDEIYNKKDLSYKNEDVYKMHTYKDAINNTKGAYVIYPEIKMWKYLKRKKN